MILYFTPLPNMEGEYDVTGITQQHESFLRGVLETVFNFAPGSTLELTRRGKLMSSVLDSD